ncbi:MAG: type glyceraldehyde-3-phosphate dehydrogenase [Candidatus Parcubacteria bacterium]|jgi:glyceraldehyde 3-phosphate dehydrogenase
MSIRVAINGFGRIGRNTFKASFGRLPDIDFVAVNDLTDTKTLAHLLKYDTMYGKFDHEISYDAENIIVDGKKIRVYAEKDPTKLPWGAERIDVVLESTGRFTDAAGAGQHITAGAKRVIISAPAKGGVPTHVLGVNPEGAGEPVIINNASCTTNCIAPVAAVLHEQFGIAKALMTTTHSYTAEQNLVDGPPPGGKSNDLRRARAAAANIIPTSTGAAIAVTETIPELKGLFDGMALRVPTTVVSLADFTFLLKRKTTAEEINAAFKEAAALPRWQGVLAVTEEPLVSSDFIGNTYSSIVDLSLTKVVDGDLVKVIAWYDNEWGYSCRLGEMALLVGRSLQQ